MEVEYQLTGIQQLYFWTGFQSWSNLTGLAPPLKYQLTSTKKNSVLVCMKGDDEET